MKSSEVHFAWQVLHCTWLLWCPEMVYPVLSALQSGQVGKFCSINVSILFLALFSWNVFFCMISVDASCMPSGFGGVPHWGQLVFSLSMFGHSGFGQ